MTNDRVPLDLQRLAVVIGMGVIENVSLQQQLDAAHESLREAAAVVEQQIAEAKAQAVADLDEQRNRNRDESNALPPVEGVAGA